MTRAFSAQNTLENSIPRGTPPPLATDTPVRARRTVPPHKPPRERVSSAISHQPSAIFSAFSLQPSAFPRHGFTLLEVLMSMLIISAIAGLVVGFARYANHMARRHQALAQLTLWHEAAERWHERFGEFPLPADADTQDGVTVEDLYFATDENVVGFDRVFHEQTGVTTNAPTLPQRSDHQRIIVSFRDPWNQPYRYRCRAPQAILLWSTGANPDKTSDDLYLRQ